MTENITLCDNVVYSKEEKVGTSFNFLVLKNKRTASRKAEKLILKGRQ